MNVAVSGVQTMNLQRHERADKYHESNSEKWNMIEIIILEKFQDSHKSRNVP